VASSATESAAATATETPTDTTQTTPFEGTIGVLEVTRSGQVATLTAVRAATHEGYDRVVFELSVGDEMPGYHVEYIDKPVRDCGEGSAKEVAGDAWLEVRMMPGNAHTEAGQPTIPFREQSLDLPVIRELERTCDFEAVTTWVIGLGSPNPYRVQELSDPPRLVVDIAHSPRRTEEQ
jgi:hypothetical protein